MDNIYCYDGTDVLINKLGIHDVDKLQEVERRLVSARLYELYVSPIPGDFDFNHLKDIHRFLFQDLYEWAGEIRRVDIAKGNMFCNVRFIESQAKTVFDALAAMRYLQDLERGEMVKRMAFYMSEINAIHPFREGNGRTQREFMRELALFNDYELNFSRVSRQEMIEASIDSFVCNYEGMELVFEKALSA